MKTQKTVKDLEPFLISYKRYVNLTDEDILTFNAFSREQQEVLYKMLIPNYNLLALEEAQRMQKQIIVKPEYVKINHKELEVWFFTKSGVLALPLEDDILNAIQKLGSQRFYVQSRVMGKVVFKRTFAVYLLDYHNAKFFKASYDTETARSLLNEFEPLTLLLSAVGYYDTPETRAMILPKLLPIFQPFDKSIHTVQLTAPRTGKTETAKILATISNGYYAGLLPKPTKLIYNANTGQYGLTYYYDTIWVDEFDKIKGIRKQVFQETYEILLSGMDNGIWQREASSKVADFQKWVGFCFMGNILNYELPQYSVLQYQQSARDKLWTLLEEYGISYPKPFIERICYVEFNTADVQVYKYLNYDDYGNVKYLHPKISRGVIKLLKEECKTKKAKKKPESQFDVHYNNMTAILETLNVEIDEQDVIDLISGHKTFLEVLTKQDSEQKEQITVEEWDLADYLNEEG